MSQYHVVEPGALHTGPEEGNRWIDPNAEHSLMDRVGIGNRKGIIEKQTLLAFDVMNARWSPKDVIRLRGQKDIHEITGYLKQKWGSEYSPHDVLFRINVTCIPYNKKNLAFFDRNQHIYKSRDPSKNNQLPVSDAPGGPDGQAGLPEAWVPGADDMYVPYTDPTPQGPKKPPTKPKIGMTEILLREKEEELREKERQHVAGLLADMQGSNPTSRKNRRNKQKQINEEEES